MRAREIEEASEIQCTSDSLTESAAALSREIHLRDQIQRELDARDKGRVEGKAEFIAEVALKLHKEQYSIKASAGVINLSEDEVLCIVQSRH